MTQAPNSSKHHDVVLPRGVGFSPDDDEIIELCLTPRINKEDMQDCLIETGDLYPIISGEAGPWDIKTYPYFQKNHYWFFVKREPVKRGSDFVAQRSNLLGTWRSRSRSNVMKGNLVLGYKQKLEFMTKEDLNSGWYQIEYTKISKTFQETAVSHLVYDKDKDQVAHANLQRQHVNDQENGKEGFVRDHLPEENKFGPSAHKKIKIETGPLAHTSKIKIETGALADTSEIKTETSA